ncbi:MAG: histone deacetylase family protein [Pseudomonadota bacterium]
MKLIAFTAEAGFDHHPPDGHPERLERLHAVHRALEAEAAAQRPASLATSEQLARFHDTAHIDAVFAASPEQGETPLDADTWMSAGSLEAALHAAGGGVDAVDAVMAGEAEAAFVACRPPGHHAEPDRAMGFCLFNTVGVAAMHALEAHGMAKVMVVDIDVHHGNGTQALAEIEPRLVFASIHQGWIYPGTGAAHETGRTGNILNVPLPAGTDGRRWREAMEQWVLPRIEAEAPDLLLVSVGFDAHRADPLAGLALDESDYAWAGAVLGARARSVANSRLVCVLEGGYDCAALEGSTRAFWRALADA